MYFAGKIRNGIILCAAAASFCLDACGSRLKGSEAEQENLDVRLSCNETEQDSLDIRRSSNTGDMILPVIITSKYKSMTEDRFDLVEALLSGETVVGSIEKCFTYSKRDGFSAAQGAATDGTYVYIVMTKKTENGAEIGRIAKVDAATWEVVRESEDLPLDHGNDMTYDSVENRLLVTNMLNNKVSIIDPETLEITDTLRFAFGTYAAGYDEVNNRFVFAGYGALGGIVITDEEFKVKNIPAYPLALAEGYVGQGMDADENYIYVPLSPNTGTEDNIVQVYDWDGNYFGNISIPSKQEIETIFHIGDQFYAQFNYMGATIYMLDIAVGVE